MKKRRYLQSKVFRRYLISYLSVVLIMLSVLGVIEMRRVAISMRKEEIRLTESKLNIVVEDLENQVEAMRKMVIEIANSPIFRSDYFGLSKYHEIQLLDQLHRYHRNSEIGSEYFMSYESNDIIYTSGGSASFLQVYLSEWLDEEECRQFIELLNGLYLMLDEALVLYEGNDVVFFVYPLQEYGFSGKGKNGVVCFVVSEASVLECVEKFMGELNGKSILTFQNHSLLEQEGNEGEIELNVTSEKGNCTMFFYPAEEEFFVWGNVFSTKDILLLTSAIFLIFLFGFIIAYWNFLPLRKIVDKYKHEVDNNLSPDWTSVDVLFETLLQNRERDRKLWREKLRVMKEQIIRTIALGGYSDKVQECLELLNIELPGPVYGIIKCTFPEVEYAKMSEEMNQSIEELSGEGLFYYMYCDEALNVLVSAEEEYQLEEALEMLQALFESLGVCGKTEITCISRKLEKMHLNIKKSKTKKEEKKASKDNVEQCEQDTIGWNALNYIKEHCTDYDLSLDRVAEEFQLTSPYLCSIIKKQTGVSYKKFLTKMRLEEAKRLLKDTDLNVINISQTIGYNNVSHFIKVFQEHIGMTPGKYREEGEGYEKI